MQYEIKRIDTWSAIRIVFIISLIIGLITSIFYSLFITTIGTFLSNFGSSEFGGELPSMGGIGFIFLVFFLTIFFAVIYTLLSAVVIALYNVIAGWAGGVLIHLEKEEPKPPYFHTETEESVL